MAEEEEGEDADDEVIGVGRDCRTGRDIEVAAEQPVEDLTESDVRRTQGSAVEVAGTEEAIADDTAHHHGGEDHIGQRCAQQARTAGDLQA